MRKAGGGWRRTKGPTERGAENSGQSNIRDGCGSDAAVEKVREHFGLDHAVHAEGEKDEAADGACAKRCRGREAAESGTSPATSTKPAASCARNMV